MAEVPADVKAGAPELRPEAEAPGIVPDRPDPAQSGEARTPAPFFFRLV